MNNSPLEQNELDSKEIINLSMNIGNDAPSTIIAYVNRYSLENFSDGMIELTHPLLVEIYEDGVFLRPLMKLTDTSSVMIERYLILGHANPNERLAEMYVSIINSDVFRADIVQRSEDITYH